MADRRAHAATQTSIEPGNVALDYRRRPPWHTPTQPRIESEPILYPTTHVHIRSARQNTSRRCPMSTFLTCKVPQQQQNTYALIHVFLQAEEWRHSSISDTKCVARNFSLKSCCDRKLLSFLSLDNYNAVMVLSLLSTMQC